MWKGKYSLPLILEKLKIRFWLSCLGPLVLLLPKLWIIWLSNLSILSLPDEGYSRKTSCVRTKFDIYVCITIIDIGDLIQFWLSCLNLLVYILQRLLNYLAFQSLDYELTWRKLFQKRVIHTKLDICVATNYRVTICSITVLSYWLSGNQLSYLLYLLSCTATVMYHIAHY